MDETTQRAGQSWTQFLIIGILYGGLLWYQFQYVLVKKVTMPALAIFVGAAVILAIIALAWPHHVPAAGGAPFFASRVYWPMIGVLLVITAVRFGAAYLHFQSDFPVLPVQRVLRNMSVNNRAIFSAAFVFVVPLVEQTLFTRLWFNALWTKRHYALLTIAILLGGLIQGVLVSPEAVIGTVVAIGIGWFISFLGGITQNFWAAVVVQAVSNFLLVFIY